jgi:hypothetical protein
VPCQAALIIFFLPSRPSIFLSCSSSALTFSLLPGPGWPPSQYPSRRRRCRRLLLLVVSSFNASSSSSSSSFLCAHAARKKSGCVVVVGPIKCQSVITKTRCSLVVVMHEPPRPPTTTTSTAEYVKKRFIFKHKRCFLYRFFKNMFVLLVFVFLQEPTVLLHSYFAPPFFPFVFCANIRVSVGRSLMIKKKLTAAIRNCISFFAAA